MSDATNVTCHATCVLVGRAGILIRGRSGSGKSITAASLISKGGRLVSDDRVRLVARAGRLLALAPASIAGLLELRGIGPVSYPYERAAIVRLVVDLVDPADVPRLPDQEETSVEIAAIAVDRMFVAAPGEAGSSDAAQLVINAAIETLSARRALHLPPVSP